MSNLPALAELESARTLVSGIPLTGLEKVMQDDSGNIVARGVGKGTRNVDAAIEEFDTASKTIFKASDAMRAQLDTLSRTSKTAISRAKDSAFQMADAMNRVTKVIGPDFEKKLTQLERLTDCMERLAELDKAGKLVPVLAALASPSQPR